MPRGELAELRAEVLTELLAALDQAFVAVGLDRRNRRGGAIGLPAWVPPTIQRYCEKKSAISLLTIVADMGIVAFVNALPIVMMSGVTPDHW